MSKLTLCPGPGALIPRWKNSQKEFLEEEMMSIKKLKKEHLIGFREYHQKICVPIPGAATTAAYVCFENFLSKKF